MSLLPYLKPRRGGVLLLALLAAACTDSTPLTPAIEEPAADMLSMRCDVDVPSAAMTCSPLQPASNTQGISATRIFGGQERNVKLTNVGGSTGPGTFEINVTVQNLTQQALGTSDGVTVSGIRVFFMSGPNVTVGTGDVTVANADSAFILEPEQKYFLYNQILQPYEISAAQPWQFTLTGTVTRFSFVMAIQAAQPNEALDFADRVWDGSTSSDWTDGTNWEGGVAPDSGSTVLIPADSLFAGNMPTLPADAQVTNLRVGFGSTLTLAGFTLTAWGNVDGAGSITGGTLWVRGTNAILSGNLPSVRVSSGASLQAATRTSGAVSISDGSLVVSGSTPLSISIP